MTLPSDIEQMFYDVLNGDITILEFEQWIYAEKRLEIILNSNDFLELISYGYKDEKAKHGLYRILEKHLDKGKIETRRIRKLLIEALKRNSELPEILRNFYDLYCKGYSFFDNLGLGYGLRIVVPGTNDYKDSWEDLSDVEQATILNSFYLEIDAEINKVIFWLDTGKVILTGIKDENNHFEYLDNRTEIEKQNTAYKVATLTSSTQKPWWKLW